MLPHLLKSIQRFMQTRDLGNKANSVLLRFFADLIRTVNKGLEPKGVFNNYHAMLLPFKNDPTQNIVMETLDLLKWMERKGGMG